jgi:CRISPR-associated endonuclease/helicase Cas3
MVMAIWLIARAMNTLMPQRLIYVVDRRTVVDQATDLAVLLRANAAGLFPTLGGLSISTLRGQLADNREWSRDPAQPAIIIGTVDLIGSALLFSGYRSSYRRRPLEAGLLGQDSLLVLDEAHLSRPFEKLVQSIEREGSFQKDHDGKTHGVPMQVIRMSATSGNSTGPKPFTLQFDDEGNLTGEDAKDKSTVDRFGAKKTLRVVESEKPVEAIATEADKLATEKPGSRIVIFVQTPRQVADVRKTLERKKKDYATRIAQLTGTMRGLERDELVDTTKPLEDDDHERRAMQRFLKTDNDPSKGSCFLISTSAGEVGFDLNADHMVCDATTIDSLIQRLGRVNRRGQGEAQVHLFAETTKKNKDGKPKKLDGLDKAIANTIILLQDIKDGDVSPKNIAAFKASDAWRQKDDNGKSAYENACSPEPTTVELTDILLDAWSMTSITEPMPGRPEVGPWLRGIADEQAQTTIAWRAELELLHNDPTPEKALSAIFAKHPIRPHESLTVNTGYLLEFLKQIPKLKERPHDLMTTRVAVRMSRGQVTCRTLQQLTVDPGILYADSTLILPAKFGGLDSAGMLEVESVPKTRGEDDPEPPSLDVADREGYGPTDAARSRLRILIDRSQNRTWTPAALPGGAPISEDIKLQLAYDKSTALFNNLRAADLRVRFVQPIRFNEEGESVQSLVILGPAPAEKSKEDQLLTDHIGAVEAAAKRIADALGLAESDPIRIALLFAARWHDEGKKARIWQVFANNPDPDGPPLGKMAQSRDPKSLRGYRHEFGSLLRIQCSGCHGTTGCELPDDPDARELALHLITTHHGAGRPHFGHALYDPFTDAERDAVHTESIRRFARLQRKYGWWRLAWLENLLRCADALASADQDAEDDGQDSEGGDE